MIWRYPHFRKPPYIYIHTLWLFTKSELENHQLFIGEIIMFIIYKWTTFQSYVK